MGVCDEGAEYPDKPKSLAAVFIYFFCVTNLDTHLVLWMSDELLHTIWNVHVF